MTKPFDDLTPRARPFVLVAFAVLVLVAIWRMSIVPARVGLAKQQALCALMTADLARARAAAGQMPALERDVHALEVALRQTGADFHGVDEKNPDAVLRDLHDMSGESALTLLGATPKPIVSRPQYTEQPVELVLEGTYQGLGRFLERVARAPGLLTVPAVDIKTSSRPGARGNLQVTVLISTLVLATETAPSSPATADRQSRARTAGTM